MSINSYLVVLCWVVHVGAFRAYLLSIKKWIAFDDAFKIEKIPFETCMAATAQVFSFNFTNGSTHKHRTLLLCFNVNIWLANKTRISMARVSWKSIRFWLRRCAKSRKFSKRQYPDGQSTVIQVILIAKSIEKYEFLHSISAQYVR